MRYDTPQEFLSFPRHRDSVLMHALRFARNTTFAVFVIYLALTVAALWSLIAAFGSAVPFGHSTDYYQFHWNYWWMRHALSTGTSFSQTNYVLFPQTHDLVLHTLTPIWLPLYVFVEPIGGRHVAVNLMVVLSFPLTGTVTYLWLRRLLDAMPGTGAWWIAFLGGLVFAFSPYMLDHAANTHLNLIPLWWFPLSLLVWDEVAFTGRLPRKLTAPLMALVLWGMALTDLEFAVWLPFLLGPYVLWTLWRRRDDRRALILWGSAILAMTAALLLVWPLQDLLAVPNRTNPDEFPPAGMNTIRAYALPIEALVGLAPLEADRTLGRVPVWLMWGGGVIAVLRWLRNRAAQSVPSAHPPAWFWLLIALPPLILSLGPDVTLAGQAIRLPYLPLHELLNGQYRNPVRFAQPALLALICFLALTWRPLLGRLRRFEPAVGLTLGVILLVDAGALAPFPARSLPQPEVYATIADTEGQFVVVDLPVGVHYGWTGIGVGQVAMYYGPVHQKPMVNGTLSRMPYSALDYYLRSPLWTWLAGVYQPEPDELPAIEQAFAGILTDWPVGYVVAHRDWMTESQQRDWIGWVNVQPGLCPAAGSADGSVLWWRTDMLGCPEDQDEILEMGAAASWTRVGPGWYDPENIGGPEGRWAQAAAMLRVVLPADTAIDVQFSAAPFGDGRTVRLRTSTWIGDEIPLPPGWQTVTVRLPVGALDGGLLTLEHNGTAPTAAVAGNANARDLAAAYSTFTFTLVEDE